MLPICSLFTGIQLHLRLDGLLALEILPKISRDPIAVGVSLPTIALHIAPDLIVSLLDFESSDIPEILLISGDYSPSG
jgi:hypothetical protein